MLARSILLKKGIRTDSIWLQPLIYRSFLTRLPVLLDLWALKKSRHWLRSEIESLQDMRLSTLSKDASRLSFWNDSFRKSGVLPGTLTRANITALPIVSKNTYVETPADEIRDRGLLSVSIADQTSGSTGQPFKFYFDRYAELRSFAITERLLQDAGDGSRFPVVYMRARYRQGFTFRKHVWFFLRGFNSVKHRFADLVTVGRKMRAFILYGYTSSIVEAARCAEESGQKLPLRAVMSTGEAIRATDRAYVERIFGTRFVLVYASREAGWLAHECEHRALHINEEWAYIEIVDASGKPVPPTHEGRIAVTTFDNRVMPFIRYDIGDRGAISEEPCACGRTSRTISISGREAERLRFDDIEVSLLDISAAIDSFEHAVRQFQVEQTGPFALRIRVVPGKTYAAARDELGKLLMRVTHPRIRIEWETVDEILPAQSGKAKYFVRTV